MNKIPEGGFKKDEMAVYATYNNREEPVQAEDGYEEDKEFAAPEGPQPSGLLKKLLTRVNRPTILVNIPETM